MQEKLDKRIVKFLNRLDRFNEVLSPKNDIERDALIKRFEFTFDSGWKALKNFLEVVHTQLDIQSPIQAFKGAFLVSVFTQDDVDQWTIMRNARNQTAHEYKELIAEDVAKLASEFSRSFIKLSEILKK